MIAGRCQDNHNIYGFALHHAIHVFVVWECQTFTDCAGILLLMSHAATSRIPGSDCFRADPHDVLRFVRNQLMQHSNHDSVHWLGACCSGRALRQGGKPRFRDYRSAAGRAG